MSTLNISQDTLDKIVDYLCKDKKADAILLYHRLGNVELEQAWATVQAILVDLGETNADLPQRAIDDAAYLEARYYVNWERSVPIEESIMGKCTFKQLPQRYQALFQIGPNHIKRVTFFPEENIICLVLMALPFLFLWSIAPFWGLFVDFPLMWAWNTWPRILFFLHTLIVFIPPPIMGVYLVRISRVMLEFLRRKKAGAHIYGLVIDGNYIVGRQLTAFERKKNCLFLPCDRIQNIQYSRGGRSSPAKLYVQILNTQGQHQWLTFDSSNSFGLKPSKLDSLFQSLTKQNHRA